MDTPQETLGKIRSIRIEDSPQSERDRSHKAPVFISYATTAYHDHAGNLEHDLHELGLDYAITYYHEQPTWRNGCGRKPEFIRDHLHEFRGPVIWLDADSRVHAYPRLLVDDLPEREVDFACWFSMGAAKERHPFGDKSREILNTGTMFWNSTYPSLDLLSLWTEAEHGQYEAGQRVLAEIWHRYERHITWERLPQRYCKIPSLRWKKHERGPAIITNLVYSFTYGRSR